MKYIKQFLIILSVSFLGEVLHALLPLPVPASIYGLVLMLAALCTGLLKLPQIEKTGLFLVDIMAVMFIPAAVGLVEEWGTLQPILIPVSVITVVVTVIVMAVTGWVTQLIIRADKSGKKEGK